MLEFLVCEKFVGYGFTLHGHRCAVMFLSPSEYVSVEGVVEESKMDKWTENEWYKRRDGNKAMFKGVVYGMFSFFHPDIGTNYIHYFNGEMMSLPKHREECSPYDIVHEGVVVDQERLKSQLRGAVNIELLCEGSSAVVEKSLQRALKKGKDSCQTSKKQESAPVKNLWKPPF